MHLFHLLTSLSSLCYLILSWAAMLLWDSLLVVFRLGLKQYEVSCPPSFLATLQNAKQWMSKCWNILELSQLETNVGMRSMNSMSYHVRETLSILSPSWPRAWMGCESSRHCTFWQCHMCHSPLLYGIKMNKKYNTFVIHGATWSNILQPGATWSHSL